MAGRSSQVKGSHTPREVQARFSLSGVKYWLRMEQVALEGLQNTWAPEPAKVCSRSASAGSSLVNTAVRFPLRAAAKPEATTAPPTSLRSLPW